MLVGTSKDLKNEISNKKFREDLYHRLAVILIQVPSLNERREDIPLLVDHFAKTIAKENGDAPKTFSKSALNELKSYNWTGNIRELRNVIERLHILGDYEITKQDVELFASK